MEHFRRDVGLTVDREIQLPALPFGWVEIDALVEVVDRVARPGLLLALAHRPPRELWQVSEPLSGVRSKGLTRPATLHITCGVSLEVGAAKNCNSAGKY